MFPLTVILLEREPCTALRDSAGLVKQILLNPMVLSTLIGLVWAITGLPIPAPVAAYLNIIAARLRPARCLPSGLACRSTVCDRTSKASFALATVKLVVMPLIVYGLCVVTGLNPLYTVAAVICAAVPTAKTVYVLAHEHKVEEKLVAATVSVTTMLSVATLLVALYLLSGLAPGTR